MSFITAQQAAEKWGLQVRQVQGLCKSGKIAGAIRFSRSWAIPERASKPADGRTRISADSVPSPSLEKTIHPDPEVFIKAFEHLPFSINITDMEGTMIFANEIFFRGTLPGTREKALGNYNILSEGLLEHWGLRDHVARAFRGESVCTPQLRFPNKDLQGDKYGKKAAFFSLYNDVYSYPLFDSEGVQRWVVTVLIPVRKLTGRREVVQVKEHIDRHWMEPFDSRQLAYLTHMSASRLMEIFREDTGFSPYDYYTEVKLTHLKEYLLDLNISVAQAFSACGMDYNSHYTGFFKKHVGMTPLQFRKTHR